VSGFSQNRLRQLQGLVSIDAWHTPPTSDRPRADLHVYAYFDEGRLGGCTEDSLAFNMVLRQAELRINQTEPRSFGFDPAKIWRGEIDKIGRAKQTRTEQQESTRDLEAKVEVRPTTLSGSAGGKAHLAQGTSTTSQVEVEESLKKTLVSFSRTDRTMPTWVLKPGSQSEKRDGISYLHGSPWSSDQQRLLQLVRRNGHRGDDSDVRISLVCRREDLYFYGIRVRNAAGEFEELQDAEPRRVAIQEYLRGLLLREELPAPDMNSPYSLVTLGIVVSEPRHPDDW